MAVKLALSACWEQILSDKSINGLPGAGSLHVCQSFASMPNLFSCDEHRESLYLGGLSKETKCNLKYAFCVHHAWAATFHVSRTEVAFLKFFVTCSSIIMVSKIDRRVMRYLPLLWEKSKSDGTAYIFNLGRNVCNWWEVSSMRIINASRFRHCGWRPICICFWDESPSSERW